ncbi:MAG: carbamoyltransferase HypF [Acidobacteria bacterium]|nr:carbamoyltransferase HypF [Acidobacteriota bacterium]
MSHRQRLEPASADALPDIALCESCRGELLDPNNRRYRYPFINCAHCGPRRSIIDHLPYTRANTSMRGFVMCHACEREYHNPLDRRYHAEPNACPVCGPHVALCDASGAVVAERDSAITAAANAIRAGRLVAVKGLGGYRLLADATDEASLSGLQLRHRREDALLVVMCPDLECIQQHAWLSPADAQMLVSPHAPIVLVDARINGPHTLSPAVLGNRRQLGVLLPSTPLQVLLMRDLRRPIAVTTSSPPNAFANTAEREAIERFDGVADVYLVHDRPILRHVPDTFARVL